MPNSTTSQSSKTTERPKETLTGEKRVVSKPTTRPDKRVVKRYSTNCLGSSELNSKPPLTEVEKTTGTKCLQRRATMNSFTPMHYTNPGGKPRFLALGNKVKSLVKCRLAFQMKNKASGGAVERANTMEVIHKMPTAARFSSFLSPEAQYSLMKGYEDVLHSQLVQSHPECNTFLVRNKTPMNPIGIRKKTKSVSGLETTSETKSEKSSCEEDQEPQDADEQSDVVWRSVAEQKDSPGKLLSRRPSLPSSQTISSLNLSPRSLKRTQSLQTIPHDRRLVLTYRLESAMDILDTIRHKNGQVPLSPRVVQKTREITPITDYNSWATVWCKEFNIKT